MRFRRFAGVGTAAVAVLWLFASFATDHDVEACEAGDAFICLSLGEAMLVWALFLGGIWLFVLFVVGAVVGLVRYYRWRTTHG
jgi:hypothetical protein